MGLAYFFRVISRDVDTEDVQAHITQHSRYSVSVCVYACANTYVYGYTLSTKLIMSEGKSEIPGGYQLKFLCLGNNACVIQATRNYVRDP